MTVGELCEKIGDELRHFFPAHFLPQTKNEIWICGFGSLLFIYICFIMDTDIGLRGADLSPNKIKYNVEIEYVNEHYYDGERTFYFEEKSTNTKYKTSSHYGGNANKLSYFFSKYFDERKNDALYIDFLPYSEYKDRLSSSGKSYLGTVLKIKQGEKLVFAEPNNYLEILSERKRNSIKNHRKTMLIGRFIILLYIYAIIAQIRFLFLYTK